MWKEMFNMWEEQKTGRVKAVWDFIYERNCLILGHGGIRSATRLPISVSWQKWKFHVDCKTESLPPGLFQLTCHATNWTVPANWRFTNKHIFVCLFKCSASFFNIIVVCDVINQVFNLCFLSLFSNSEITKLNYISKNFSLTYM